MDTLKASEARFSVREHLCFSRALLHMALKEPAHVRCIGPGRGTAREGGRMRWGCSENLLGWKSVSPDQEVGPSASSVTREERQKPADSDLAPVPKDLLTSLFESRKSDMQDLRRDLA
ncbi:hypothetical protein NDU88_005664 [Pleurodeles waltl]|uniref:Uncharacterized protein n=1 Tax=Pleurodeles waltl TaxID=8319 RepID=A0AAV7SMG8_PLEWA|nr:hypothetical protein NDU88_005664 [Pleurodeles waltl]